MRTSRIAFLQEIWRNRAVRYGSIVLAVFTTWDVCSNQFGWPKIPAVWSMTGAILPLWAWLMMAMALFGYGLFEYVRGQSTSLLENAKARSLPIQEHEGLAVEVANLSVNQTVLHTATCFILLSKWLSDNLYDFLSLGDQIVGEFNAGILNSDEWFERSASYLKSFDDFLRVAKLSDQIIIDMDELEIEIRVRFARLDTNIALTKRNAAAARVMVIQERMGAIPLSKINWEQVAREKLIETRDKLSYWKGPDGWNR